MNDQERELKVLISKEQADTLLRQNRFMPARRQINTYYDTADRTLRRQGIAARIRTIKGQTEDDPDQYILTVKKPLDSITKYEFERPVHTNVLSDLNEEEADWIHQKIEESEPLQPVATFMTDRSICTLPDAEYSIDHTRFRNHDDYEAEYEYRTDHDGISAFNKILEPAGIQWKENGPSKIARAMLDQDSENL